MAILFTNKTRCKTRSTHAFLPVLPPSLLSWGEACRRRCLPAKALDPSLQQLQQNSQEHGVQGNKRRKSSWTGGSRSCSWEREASPDAAKPGSCLRRSRSNKDPWGSLGTKWGKVSNSDLRMQLKAKNNVTGDRRALWEQTYLLLIGSLTQSWSRPTQACDGSGLGAP